MLKISMKLECHVILKCRTAVTTEGSSVQVTLCDEVCQWLATGRWFSPGTPVSSTNKTDCHDITEILLKVALNTITLTWKGLLSIDFGADR